ncbi:hypothetical protein Hdeb2414_s0024g00645471 [Helianthus debilis subsp. tardiflorus]
MSLQTCFNANNVKQWMGDAFWFISVLVTHRSRTGAVRRSTRIVFLCSDNLSLAFGFSIFYSCIIYKKSQRNQC